MADPTAPAAPPIETLLQQRTQYEQWLARLDAAGNGAPDAVRRRVRGDYEARLGKVIDELRSHAATIGEELGRHREAQTELDERRAELEERIAEARIRHEVGEYGLEEWQRIHERMRTTLSGIEDSLRQVGDEIGRLADVERLISQAPPSTPAPAAQEPEAAPPAPGAESAAAVPAAEALAAPAREPMADAVEPEPPVEAGQPVPEAVAEPVAEPEAPLQPAGQVDELAFLQSVTGETPVVTPPSAAAPEPASIPRAAAPAEAPSAQTATAAAARPVAPQTQARTLKCHECGTLNRPTEWYCERCGAELSAL